MLRVGAANHRELVIVIVVVVVVVKSTFAAVRAVCAIPVVPPNTHNRQLVPPPMAFLSPLARLSLYLPHLVGRSGVERRAERDPLLGFFWQAKCTVRDNDCVCM